MSALMAFAELAGTLPDLAEEERVARWADFRKVNDIAELAPYLVDVLELSEDLRSMGTGWAGRVDRFVDVVRRRAKDLPPADKKKRTTQAPGEVMSRLRLLPWGSVMKSTGNLAIILRFDGRWAGKVRRNDMDGGVYIDGAPLTDSILLRMVEAIDRDYEIINCKDTLSDAIQVVADEGRFHPVRDYLRGLTWDRVPRIDTMLTRYAGAEDLPHIRAIGFRWMLSAVARVMDPGCKVDTMLILAGKQGVGKSTFARVLGGPWFTDAEIDPHDVKDAVLALHGRWIVEVAEWDKWSDRDQRKIKSFVSCQVDAIRRPYGRFVEEFPRQNVFVGTTNDDGFFEDPTGSRRFLPVTVSGFDLNGLHRDRDQLWAEAYTMFDRGETWVLTAEEADAVAADAINYRSTDPWDEMVAEETRGCSVIKTGDLLGRLGVEMSKRTKADERRVGRILKALGWTREVTKEDGKSVRRWVRR
jgi:putative DNA primase/helicase